MSQTQTAIHNLRDLSRERIAIIIVITCMCIPLSTRGAGPAVAGSQPLVNDWSRTACIWDSQKAHCFDLDTGEEVGVKFWMKLHVPRDDYAGLPELSEGLIVAATSEDGKRGYIDPAGRIVIPFQFDSAGDFHEGRAWVSINRQHGIIDRGGKWVVKPEYTDIWDFNEGLCFFQKGLRTFGFMNKKGEITIKLSVEQRPFGSRFSEGLYLLSVLDSKTSVSCIDTKGNVRFTLRTPPPGGDDGWLGYQVGAFSDGLAMIGTGPGWLEGNSGFVDTKGNIVIPLRYSAVRDFSEGLAAVSNGKSWGFIDTKGALKVPMIYQTAWSFHEGLAAVCKDDRYGYLDKTGRMVIPPQYDYATSFYRGVAAVTIKKSFAFIDKKGKILVNTHLLRELPF